MAARCARCAPQRVRRCSALRNVAGGVTWVLGRNVEVEMGQVRAAGSSLA